MNTKNYSNATPPTPFIHKTSKYSLLMPLLLATSFCSNSTLLSVSTNKKTEALEEKKHKKSSPSLKFYGASEAPRLEKGQSLEIIKASPLQYLPENPERWSLAILWETPSLDKKDSTLKKRASRLFKKEDTSPKIRGLIFDDIAIKNMPLQQVMPENFSETFTSIASIDSWQSATSYFQHEMESLWQAIFKRNSLISSLYKVKESNTLLLSIGNENMKPDYPPQSLAMIEEIRNLTKLIASKSNRITSEMGGSTYNIAVQLGMPPSLEDKN